MSTSNIGIQSMVCCKILPENKIPLHDSIYIACQNHVCIILPTIIILVYNYAHTIFLNIDWLMNDWLIFICLHSFISFVYFNILFIYFIFFSWKYIYTYIGAYTECSWVDYTINCKTGNTSLFLNLQNTSHM